MNNSQPTAGRGATVKAFYEEHPYPPPVDDLEGYRRRWQAEDRRRADFHLHWPDQHYRENIQVLVAGCGTSQAARHALRSPESRVVGVDFSTASVDHTLALKERYHLANLEVHQLPLERAGELGRRFDKIVCTGVLHHLPDPAAGLAALAAVLAPGGAIHLMVYGTYGRAGVYMLQAYCRQLGIGHTEQEIRELAHTLAQLPPAHPLARLLGESPDFRRKDALADALLNPQDRPFTVPQLLELLGRCGLAFGRWVRQAPYLAACGLLAQTPHAQRLAALPPPEHLSAAELFRGNMVRHSLVAYHNAAPEIPQLPTFDGDAWLRYRPFRLPGAIQVRDRLPPGAAAVLLNQEHTDPDLILPVDATELRMVEAIDGNRTVADMLDRMSGPASTRSRLAAKAQRLFERLWQYDQVVFDNSPLATRHSSPKVSNTHDRPPAQLE
jgi:SAM-dependent methyltransferase